MDPAMEKMIASLEAKMGKPLDFFKSIVLEKNFPKHGEAVQYLKSEFGMGHGYANMVVHLAKENSSLHLDGDDMFKDQYKGKEHFIPLYQALQDFIRQLGDDIEFSPKKTYMSLRRKKQFGLLSPATKTRFEIHLNLKGNMSDDLLEYIKTPNTMCSHRICITGPEDLNDTIKQWIAQAYQEAG